MLPSWKEILNAAVKGGLQPNDLTEIAALHERIASSDELSRHAQECCDNLLHGHLDKALFDRDFQDADLERFYLLVVLMCHDAARENFLRTSMPVEGFDQAWTDIVNWPNYHVRTFHFVGLRWRFVCWYICHLRGSLVQLGRLQFEHHANYYLDKSVIQLADGSLRTWPYGQALPDGSRLVVEKEQPVLNIHIPEGGRMEPEACRQSIANAVAFMAKSFPDYPYRAFVCESWLLDTQFAEFLSPESNILQFQHVGGIVFNLDSPPETLWRIFGRGISEKNLNDAKPRTSLQRGVVDFLKKGGVLSDGALVIPREEAERMAAERNA